MSDATPRPPAAAAGNRLADIPPITRIESFNCPVCHGWVDPLNVLHRPYLDQMDYSFCRYLYIRCDGCGAAVLLRLRFAVGSQGSWVIDQTPRKIEPADRAAVVAAFGKVDGDHALALQKIFISK